MLEADVPFLISIKALCPSQLVCLPRFAYLDSSSPTPYSRNSHSFSPPPSIASCLASLGQWRPFTSSVKMAPHQPFLSHWPIFSPWDTFISPQKADHSQHSCAVLDPIPNLDRTLMVLSSKYISAPLFFLSPSHTLRHHNLTWDSVFLSHLTSTLPYATLLLTPSPQTQSALDPVALVPGYQRK